MNKKSKNRKSTQTSDFGTSGRINHDSSKFYNSKLYREFNKKTREIDFVENPLPQKATNKIFLKSSTSMDELPDCCVHLMVTSPPYNVSKQYDDDLSLDEYCKLLRSVFTETYRVLVTGGRACVNIANAGRKPYIPLHSFIIDEMLKIGFLMRGEIIWNKGASAGTSTAWGSWKSASNPCLRDVHEYILVFCKESFSRKPPQKRESTIGRDEFLEWTKSIWEFPTISAKKVGHPAPFPKELPHRLIQLFTFKDEVVLDPFCGSGTTCLAAFDDGRRYVGYDVDEKYVEISRKRLLAAKSQLTLF